VKHVLYLDFDGVLHPASAYATTPFVHAEDLAAYISPFECDIVISSSWRFQYSVSKLCARLPRELERRIVGTTGDAYVGPFARFEEIRKHLQDTYCQEPVSWRSLDDSAWEFPVGLSQLILCNPTTGLKASQLYELKRWLSRS